MKWIAPSVYPAFRCIADRCRHSCCVGWEIDVDEDSAAYYESLGGPLQQKILQKMGTGEDGSRYFIMDEKERCPFLNEQGLCDMILTYGEDVLCQICRDHPRYYQDYTDRTEVGLGLCCEEACRLMLEETEKAELVVLEDDGGEEEPDEAEKAFFALRRKIFGVLQDRSLTVDERTETLKREYGIGDPVTFGELADFLLTLEILDPAWKHKLEKVRAFADIMKESAKVADLMREQFLFSLVFRHLPGVLEGKNARDVLSWILTMESFINTMCCALGETSPKGYEENVRLFSSEIEYSDQNPEAIYTLLGSKGV